MKNFNSYTITFTQAKAVEDRTKDQAHCKIWFHQRSGKVTASNCYPESVSFKSRATRWGCEHEEQAGMEYENRMCKSHLNFTMSKCGFIIPTSYPLMGVSPDGIIKCKCCGYGVLEIKCPYSCCDKTIQERMNESKFFLLENYGEILLNVYHCTLLSGSSSVEV